MKTKLFPEKGLEIGSKDEYAILLVQVLLSTEGLAPDITPNGVFDEETERAIKVLQNRSGLKTTGKFDEETLLALSRLVDCDLSHIEVESPETKFAWAVEDKMQQPFRFMQELSHRAQTSGF